MPSRAAGFRQTVVSLSVLLPGCWPLPLSSLQETPVGQRWIGTCAQEHLPWARLITYVLQGSTGTSWSGHYSLSCEVHWSHAPESPTYPAPFHLYFSLRDKIQK